MFYNRIAKMDICDEFEKFEYCQLFINKDEDNNKSFLQFDLIDFELMFSII